MNLEEKYISYKDTIYFKFKVEFKKDLYKD